ncbi:hypothetical protein AVEN_117965-1 [Araneus ventricosus]|uniref:Uncharacterized protein n=1 Tax=Araneus ventricosus TaxID=182803 RepID=A0A4Y2H5K7_ARAVE|nr:hypothetical protein AVEN_117965-1 [Araneus ventricosus]
MPNLRNGSGDSTAARVRCQGVYSMSSSYGGHRLFFYAYSLNRQETLQVSSSVVYSGVNVNIVLPENKRSVSFESIVCFCSLGDDGLSMNFIAPLEPCLNLTSEM